jgi:hypothetical protein
MSTGFMQFHGKEKKVHPITVSDGTHTKGWGCRGAAPPPPPPNQNLKNTDFVYTVKLKVLRDLSFTRYQPLKSAAEQYTEFFKNLTQNSGCQKKL